MKSALSCPFSRLLYHLITLGELLAKIRSLLYLEVVSKQTRAYLLALFAVTAWGASFIATKIALGTPIQSLSGYGSQVSATKIALREIAPLSVVWLRFTIGLMILGGAVWMRHQFALPSWRQLLYFALLGFLGITFHQWLQSTALVTTQASTTAWIVATTPVFIAILGWIFLREVLKRIQIAGIGLAALGVILIVSQGDWRSIVAGNFGTYGDMLILISAANWALFSVLSRRALYDYSATRLMFFVMGWGWLFTTLLFLRGPGLSDYLNLSPEGWYAIAFLGVICSGLAYIAWYEALEILPASQVGVFLYIEPLVTVIVAALMLAEPVTIASVLGGAGIILGVWLVNRPKKGV